MVTVMVKILKAVYVTLCLTFMTQCFLVFGCLDKEISIIILKHIQLIMDMCVNF